jgi:hypothetical protein
MFNSPFVIPVIAIAGWVTVTWIRAHYGIQSPWDRKHGWKENPANTHVPPMFQKLMEKAMAERDVEIHSLRERIEVLEKIVTDGHKTSSLADEIERLRDKA